MGADTLHRPPLFHHHLTARSVAALDLLRSPGALFGVTPATGGLNFLSHLGRGDMRFGSVRAVAALALAFGILGSSNSGAVRPEAVSDGSSLVTPVFTPLGVSKTPVTVVVQLAGDSVAEQQANAGRKLDRDEKERIKGQLKSQHDGLRGSIEGLRGTVRANYRSAYNGIKVRIAAERVTELAALPGVVAVRPLQLMKPNNLRGIPLIGPPPA